MEEPEDFLQVITAGKQPILDFLLARAAKWGKTVGKNAEFLNPTTAA